MSEKSKALVSRPLTTEEFIPTEKVRVSGKGSWASVIKQVTNMTATEAAAYYGEACRGLSVFGDKTLRELMVMRMVYEFIVVGPSPAMFNAIADREEGRPAQQVTATVNGQVDLNVDWKDLAERMGVTEEEALAVAEETIKQEKLRVAR